MFIPLQPLEGLNEDETLQLLEKWSLGVRLTTARKYAVILSTVRGIHINVLRAYEEIATYYNNNFVIQNAI